MFGIIEMNICKDSEMKVIERAVRDSMGTLLFEILKERFSDSVIIRMTFFRERLSKVMFV